MTGLRSRTVLFALLVVFATSSLGGSCTKAPRLFIDTPANGTFDTGASIQVTGHVANVGPASVSLLINGNPVTVKPNSTWSTHVGLDPVAIVNPIVAELTLSNGSKLRKRVTVLVGDSIPDGAVSPMGVALRLNDSGLDQIEPVMASLVDLDLATLMPPGTLVIDNYCYADSIFGCLGRVDATVSGSPPPSIGSFAIDVDSLNNSVDGDILLNNLYVKANVFSVSGVGFSCTVTMTASTTDILGNYSLGSGGSSIDVTQNGGVNVVFGNFNDSTDCSGFLGGIVEFFIDLLIGDIQDLMEPEFENFLNAVDGQGNTPIAGAIEVALNDVEISGPIGTAIGVNLETPLYDVFEDTAGITLDSDAKITASAPDPNAVDLLASYHVPEAFPAFGATTPVGGLPYGMAICIGTSAFNQLLKAEIESGLLLTTITELALFGGPPEPITADLLKIFIPEMAGFPPTTLFTIELQPLLAPIVTGEDGPSGEIAEMKLPHLVATVKDVNGFVHLQFAADATLGLDIGFAAGQLSFSLGAIPMGGLSVDILENPLGTNEVALESLLTALVPLIFPSLADSLGSFPLPEFLGLQLQLVEISKNGEFMSLFTDLAPVP